MKSVVSLSTLVLLILLAACGGGGGSPSPTSVPTPATSASTAQSAAPTDQATTASPAATAAPGATAGVGSTSDTDATDPTRVYAAGTDPKTVVQGFFDAVNAKQNDAVLALADDEIDFAFGNAHGISKADLAAFLSKNTLTYTVTKLDSFPNTEEATLVVTVSDGTTLNGAASLTDGKISFIALGSLPK